MTSPRLRIALHVLIAAFTACTTTSPQKPMLDLKITNGRVLDGTGAPWFRADIGIRGDSIVAIGNLDSMTATAEIDAQDRIVSPGFIDLLGQDQRGVFDDPTVEAKVRQGVTSELTGEGTSPAPVRVDPADPTPPRWKTLGEYLDAIDRQGAAINFALLVGASNPRQMVIGSVDRAPTDSEMVEMEQIIDQAMRDGAVGISTSLIYVPAMYSTTEEIIRLARVAAKHGGVYFTHIRDEGSQIDSALDEAFRISREASIPLNVWHLKVAGRSNFGRMPQVVEKIAAERARGLDVAANIYPYPASSTGLSTLAPNWAMEGGYSALQKRLQSEEHRSRILEDLKRQVERRGERGIYVARIDNPALASFQKKFIEQIAAEMALPPEEALARLYTETRGSPQAIFFSMHEDDVRHAVRQPWVSVGADSGSPSPAARAAGTAIHPRAYGTFPRVAGHYVREGLLTLEEAVRRMTSQAAARVNLHDRGILRPGMKADVIVFDPEKLRDLSTFEEPHQFSVGVTDVVVNGVPVLRDNVMTKALPGRTLRGRGYVRK